MDELTRALWFFLPAAVANMFPIFANNIPILKNLDQPIDFHKKFRGKRILGDHKTFRGFIAGIIGGLLTVTIQMILYMNFEVFKNLSGEINYDNPYVLLIGVILGFGALFGDSVKSFFKRQAGVKSGRGWFPYDQIDYILGAYLVTISFIQFSLGTYMLVLFIGAILHPIANITAWLLKLKDKPL